MNALLKELYLNKIDVEHIQGIIVVDKDKVKSSELDYFDYGLLLITKEGKNKTTHYELMNQKVEVHFVNEKTLHENDFLHDWFSYGDIVFSKEWFVETILSNIHQSVKKQKQLKMTNEFSELLHYYHEAKQLFRANEWMDAYQSIHQTLVHLGNLSMIEQELNKKMPAWSQIKACDPEVYKLYHELIFGQEELEKKLELLLLAINFSIVSKTKIGTSHLLSVMEQKKRWSIEDLLSMKEIQHYASRLKLLLDHLVEKGKVDIIKEATGGETIFVRHYSVK